MVFENQDIGAKCAHGFCVASVYRPSEQIELGNVQCVHRAGAGRERKGRQIEGGEGEGGGEGNGNRDIEEKRVLHRSTSL